MPKMVPGTSSKRLLPAACSLEVRPTTLPKISLYSKVLSLGGSWQLLYIKASFRGELAQYVERQQTAGGLYLFESNRCQPYSTRRLRQIVKQYANAAGLTKRVYPHLFRHQLITYLTKQGIISPKLQLLSGHTTEQSLTVYRELALSDVAEEYEVAMQRFPVR